MTCTRHPPEPYFLEQVDVAARQLRIHQATIKPIVRTLRWLVGDGHSAGVDAIVDYGIAGQQVDTLAN